MALLSVGYEQTHVHASLLIHEMVIFMLLLLYMLMMLSSRGIVQQKSKRRKTILTSTLDQGLGVIEVLSWH